MAEKITEEQEVQAAPKPAASKSSGNIVKRNQTPDNIEISLPGRLLLIEPYGIVQMNEAEWASPACKPYHNILK